MNPQAYEQVLLGRHLYLNRFSSPDGFQRAVERTSGRSRSIPTDASGVPLGGGFSHDPLLRPLHGHPRFTALLRKLNLPTE